MALHMFRSDRVRPWKQTCRRDGAGTLTRD
jgi:hypothetical protein